MFFNKLKSFLHTSGSGSSGIIRPKSEPMTLFVLSAHWALPVKNLIFVTANRLNEFIRHYEAVRYDSDEIHRSHIRARRSVVHDQHVHLSFRSLGRNFNVRLKRDLEVFAGNLAVDGVNNVDTSHIYSGHLIGMPVLLPRPLGFIAYCRRAWKPGVWIPPRWGLRRINTRARRIFLRRKGAALFPR